MASDASSGLSDTNNNLALDTNALDNGQRASNSGGSLADSTTSSATLAPSEGEIKETDVVLGQDGNKQSAWHAFWRADIIALTLSCLLTAANIAVLAVLAGKQNTDWHIGKVALTPNSLTSLIGTLTRLFLVIPIGNGIAQMKWVHFSNAKAAAEFETFDKASRGPLGSLTLLYRLNIKALVASLGALLTLLALIMEPFIQQAIAYRTLLAASEDQTASISYTHVVASDEPRRDVHAEAAGLNLAFLAGLTSAKYDAHYTCAGTQCHWPPFQTLGVCSSCQDISDNFVIQCQDVMYEYILKDESYNRLPESAQYTAAFCNYTLPNMPNDTQGWSEWRRHKFWTLWDVARSNTTYTSMVSWNHTVYTSPYLDTKLIDFTTFVLPVRDITNLLTAKVTRPVITRCQLDLCVKSHNTTHFSEGVLWDSPTTTQKLRLELSRCKPWHGKHVCGAFPDAPAYSPDIMDWPQDGYWLDYEVPDVLRTMLKNSLEGYADNGVSTRLFDAWLRRQKYKEHTNWEDHLPNTMQARLQNWWPKEWSDLLGQPADGASFIALHALHQPEDVSMSTKMEQVAEALSNAFRRSNTSMSHNGTVMVETVFVEVRWPWMSFPITVVMLAVVFLVLIIRISHSKQAPIWKDSNLAVLLKDSTELELTCVKDMQKAAKNIRVRVLPQDGGKIALP